MALRVTVDRSRCVGAGNCITLAPTTFDWHPGQHAKAVVVDLTSVDDEVVREAALSCPTQAIELEDLEELLPWQLRGRGAATPKRVVRTFMFTDIVRSTNLVEALGDEAWWSVLRWHDETLRAIFASHGGEELRATGDGFFIAFDSPDAALAAAVAIQRKLDEHRKTQGFAPQVRIGVHASGVTQLGKNVQGRGIHEAARIAALANGGEILASRETFAGTRFTGADERSVELRGISEAMEVARVDWR
ncbi:MAG: 4Fe-4S domain-containing protein [Candidatus Limnocylindria bacterium]